MHELRLQARNSIDEEQALFSIAFNKANKNRKGSSSCGRGRGRGGKGKGKESDSEEDREKKPFKKSKVKCYNCQKLGHYAY